MPSWLWRKVSEVTGPAAGTAGGEVQAHWIASAEAGQRGDFNAQRREIDEVVRVSQTAGFGEVVAAVDRLRFAATTDAEPLELAIKSMTLAVHSLAYRPAADTAEDRLLNAWAALDISLRHGPDDGAACLHTLMEAATAAKAIKVLMAVELIRQAAAEANGPATEMAIGALGVKVYEAAYHREPPSKAAFGF
jgi:hypothetical protein